MNMQDLSETLGLLSVKSSVSDDMAKGAVFGVLNTMLVMTQTEAGYNLTSGDKNYIWDNVIKWLPDDFRVTAFPYEWADHGYPLTSIMTWALEKGHIVSFKYLLDDLPKEKLEGPYNGPSVRDQLLQWYLWEIININRTCIELLKPDPHFVSWRHAGSQSIAEFWVNELTVPDDPSKINFHGQNTSRWGYAGAIVVQDGRVSTHH